MLYGVVAEDIRRLALPNKGVICMTELVLLIILLVELLEIIKYIKK